MYSYKEEISKALNGVPFVELDQDIQVEIREWAESVYQLEDPEADFSVSLNQLAQDWAKEFAEVQE